MLAIEAAAANRKREGEKRMGAILPSDTSWFQATVRNLGHDRLKKEGSFESGQQYDGLP
ncbi:MAG: hypothetical protein OXC54_04100 [Rhodospirillaceae bacterium]|nr:hypothetical protein [Rhodospirillaceae bacterium]